MIKLYKIIYLDMEN